MFYAISKVLYVLVQPSVSLVLLMVLGAVIALRSRKPSWWRRLGTWVFGLAAFASLLIALTPIHRVILMPLENRFERPASLTKVDGIIMLGGASNIGVSNTRSISELNSAADRFFGSVMLAKQFPEAQLLFSGGKSVLVSGTQTEADMLAALAVEFGIEQERIVIESQSRNTFENAVLTKQALGDKAESGTYLLVTSAFHMPRSMGLFRKAGLKVLPWPVDYQTPLTTEFNPRAIENIVNFDLAFKEWIGLVAYRLSGKTDALFPSP